MELKAGYKQTEVGIIPDDWEVRKLGDVLKVKHGKSQKEIENINGQYPILGTGGLMGYTNNFLYDKESVLIGRKGTIDKPRFMNSPFWTVDTLFYTEIFNNYLPKYLYYKFLQVDWYSYNEASGVPSLNAKTIEKIEIAIPTSKTEQTAIATALSDTDALINALDKLIAKKRLIKQGAMRELLSGKKRLAGFSGDWEVKRLGDIATLKARIGWQGLTTAEYKKSGDYYLITGTEFKNGFIDWDNCFYVDYERYRQDKNIQVKENDVLVTKDGTIGKVAFIELSQPATLNSGVFVIRPVNNSFDSQFFYYVLMSNYFVDFLSQLCAGSTINHLYQKDFVNFKFKLPPTKEEQTAIAQILSDMDNEIAALEKRLAKTQQIKHGMMQELLTGKNRLI